MKKETNGKIAIAIVAMFVVALSIVGFTYAYFTATVNPNTAAKSVEVQAGLLKVEYVNGDEIVANNIVPGWESDGMTYYNATKVGEQITAYETTNNATALTEIAAINSTATAVGLAKPVTFTVKNLSDDTNTAYYAIKLTGIENGIPSTDQDNLIVSLYEGEFDETLFNDAAVAAGTVTKPTPIYSEQLAASGEQYIVDAVKTIKTTGTEHDYYLVVSYNNDGLQNTSMGASISATVEIVGLNIVDGKYVDETGTPVTLN